jgi:RNA polymerase sigma factor (sigma-70 family)
MKEYCDREIIDCLKSRKSFVVRYLSDRYLPMIRLMVYNMGGTGEDAKDIFQDGIVIILETIDKREFVLTCKFKTLFYSICENLWKKILVKRKASNNYLLRREDQCIDQDIEDKIDYKTYESIFYDSFESLDPVGKQILKLYWKEVPPKIIAKKLGYTYGYVRKKKSESQTELLKRIHEHPVFIAIKKSNEYIKNPVFDLIPNILHIKKIIQ